MVAEKQGKQVKPLHAGVGFLRIKNNSGQKGNWERAAHPSPERANYII